jgi:hypothetical protein
MRQQNSAHELPAVRTVPHPLRLERLPAKGALLSSQVLKALAEAR